MSEQETTKKVTILETIYAQRRKDVDLAKSTTGTSPEDIDALLALHLAPPLISFVDRLKRNPSTLCAKPSPSLMAEIKRASPSKGPIALTANAAQQSLAYALAGASVISVLTEPTWFKGSLLDLRLARQAVDALEDRPAFLRKEFILDEYQIAEARLYGADTILLIVAMLSPDRLRALYNYSLSLNMEPLVEVNNAAEMALALDLGAKVIGVNNRNLHDFNVDMGTTSRLADMVRDRDVILCALSGISHPKDVEVYNKQGVGAVLIGEALMRADDTSNFIRELLQWPHPTPDTKEKAWVMVSGVTTAAKGIELAHEGADLLGLIFDSTSSRNLTVNASAHLTAALLSYNVPSESTENGARVSETLSPAPWFTMQRRNLQSTPRNFPLLVGIFRGKSLPEIIHTVRAAKLDLVDIDGTVPDAWIQYIPVPTMRRFQIGNLDEISRPGLHSFAVLDRAAASSKEADSDIIITATTVTQKGETAGWPMPVLLGRLPIKSAWEIVQSVRPWAVEVMLEDVYEGDIVAALKDIKNI